MRNDLCCPLKTELMDSIPESQPSWNPQYRKILMLLFKALTPCVSSLCVPML